MICIRGPERLMHRGTVGVGTCHVQRPPPGHAQDVGTFVGIRVESEGHRFVNVNSAGIAKSQIEGELWQVSGPE